MTTVSVALCTYNGERFVDRQLASVLEQTVVPDQVVVFDDASSDGTMAIVEAWAERARARGVAVEMRSGPRVGVTRNFERCLGMCFGDVIILCDQDDVWLSDRVSSVVASFTSDPRLSFGHGDATLIDGNDRELGVTLFRSLHVTRRERARIARGRAFEVYLRRNLATGAASAMAASLPATAQPFPDEWVHDEWLAMIAAAVGSVRILPGNTVRYRQHSDNQIGVQAGGVVARLRRMLASPPDRNSSLARRSEILADRLERLEADPAVVALARRKAFFEGERARFASNRLVRLHAMLGLWLKGDYGRFASQGSLDLIRDLVRSIPRSK